MKLLGKGIEYALEIVKFYLVFRWLFGVEIREGKWKYGLAVFVLAAYTVYEVWIYENSFLVYLLFIIVEIGLFFQDNIVKIIFMNLWLVSVIGIFDEISKIMIWAFLDMPGNKSIWMRLGVSMITIMAEIISGKIVMKFNKKKKIHMNMKYYILFFILGWAYSYIMGYLKLVLGNEGLDTCMHFDVVITGLIMYIHIIMSITLVVSRDNYKEKEAFDRYLLEMQKEQYQYLEKREKDIRNFRHDIKDHIMSIQEYCETENYEKLKEYINEINGRVYIDKKRVTVHNQIVDMVLNQYISKAEDMGVQFKIQGQISEDCPIVSYDLCVIFANLLKNGIEAAKNTKEKLIELVVGYDDDIMMIHMKNDYIGKRKKKNGKYVTTKSNKENHGIGTENVKESVEKYHGHLEMREENGKFLTTITISLNLNYSC